MPKLSIIIATFNRHEELRRCLSSLGSLSTREKNRLEIIVVDQTATEFSSRSDFPFATFVHSPRGASLARNFGASISSGEYLLFFDDDALMLDLDLSFSEDIVFLRWIEKPVSNLLACRAFKKLYLLRKSGSPFFITRKEIFNASSGFDPALGPGTEIFGSEDLDYLIRASRISRRIRYVPVGVVSHAVSTSLHKNFMYAYSRGKVLKQNKEYFLVLINLIYFLFSPDIFRSKSRFFAFLQALTGRDPI